MREEHPEIMEYIEQLRREHMNLDAPSNNAYYYTRGLRDAGIITERERQILFVYTTIKYQK